MDREERERENKKRYIISLGGMDCRFWQLINQPGLPFTRRCCVARPEKKCQRQMNRRNIESIGALKQEVVRRTCSKFVIYSPVVVVFLFRPLFFRTACEMCGMSTHKNPENLKINPSTSIATTTHTKKRTRLISYHITCNCLPYLLIYIFFFFTHPFLDVGH